MTDFIIIPRWTEVSTLAFLSQIGFGLILGALEGSGRFQLPYSKFRGAGKINSRAGMFIIYFLPILTYLWYFFQGGAPQSMYHLVLLVAFLFLFGKRCLEVLFLQRYSGGIGLTALILITFFYSAIAYMASIWQNIYTPATVGSTTIYLSTLLPGLLIFLAGMWINFYHHLLLARLRKGDNKEYTIPRGGLFRYVTCPHYLGEIIAWLGYAIMSKHLAVYGLVFIIICYLSARSFRTRIWYRNTFPDYPADRKALLPFIF